MMRWVVWSEEHGGWWAGIGGYTRSLHEAARFDQSHAGQIERNANAHLPVGQYNEIALPDPVALWRVARGFDPPPREADDD